MVREGRGGWLMLKKKNHKNKNSENNKNTAFVRKEEKYSFLEKPRSVLQKC